MKRTIEGLNHAMHKESLKFLNNCCEIAKKHSPEDGPGPAQVTLHMISATLANTLQAMVRSALEHNGTEGVAYQVMEESRKVMDVWDSVGGTPALLEKLVPMLQEELPCMSDPQAMAGLGEHLMSSGELDGAPEEIVNMVRESIKNFQGQTPEYLGEVLRKLDEQAEAAFDPANDFRDRMGDKNQVN